VILVTLGTHPRPMDRLVIALDSLLETREIVDEVLFTAATYGHRPVRAKALGIQPYETLVKMMEDASAVITHGGPASIAMALSAGHIPVVVPRNPALHEHVDDHQVRFAQWFAKRRGIEVVLEMEDIGPAIARTLGRRRKGPRQRFEPTQAIERLRSILNVDRS
jgi:UDP-N-acetylglucosamine transferase subunit ALG13